GIRGDLVTGVQTCALPIWLAGGERPDHERQRADCGDGDRLGAVGLERHEQGHGQVERKRDYGLSVGKRLNSEDRGDDREWRGTLDRKSVVEGKRGGRGGLR